MQKDYDPKKIEEKWTKLWYNNNIYEAVDFSEKPKKYILAEFPYPSGQALHAGHMMRYTVPDVYARYLRMKGYNVLFPMSWDAFGLPAENYAVKTGINPATSTKEIIGHYKESIKKMGYGIDWNREFATTDPNYYKWTQWIFLLFYKAGLAEYREMPIWWCETLRTVLADEEVLTDKNGNKISERGEHPVERKMFKQWVLKMPAYAERLIEGLRNLDFPEAIKSAQTNWIGKSEGAEIKFKIFSENQAQQIDELKVFTTRPDTIFGVTFMAVAPEHSFVQEVLKHISNKEAVIDYLNKTKNISDLERQTSKEKTGIKLEGIYAQNPLNGNPTPVYAADYILKDYGFGAIMGVPAHDDRDFEFAKKFGINIIQVIESSENEKLPFTTYGKVINSGEYNGITSEEFCKIIIKKLEKEGLGSGKITYKLRDWVFSRQRYWGEPIPVVHFDNGDISPICDPDNNKEVEENLPLVLPEVPDYNPTADGSSPLDRNKDWVNVDFDGKSAKRETNTMPNWAGSCWYYLRYCDPKNDQEFANYEKLKYWLPVDRYFGGAEHTTLHLLYSRFWHQFLYDLKKVPTPEPYQWRMNGGLLLGPDGKKMSKSKGNVVEPMEVIEKYGADALRLSICFLGPYEDTYPWNENSIKTLAKLVCNVYALRTKVDAETPEDGGIEFERNYHSMVKKVSGMVENLKMNTAISEFMIFVGEAKKVQKISPEIWKGFIKLFAPFAPYVSEQLWQELHGSAEILTKETSVHMQPWPEFNPQKLETSTIVIPVQINGRVRAEIEISHDDTEEHIKDIVLANKAVKKNLAASEIKKFIYVPNKIVNIVLL